MYFHYKPKADNAAPGAWPVWTTGTRLAEFIKRSTIHCYTHHMKALVLGSPNPKKWLSFGFVGIFEYIILPMLIIFLGMCPNSYGWMPSL